MIVTMNEELTAPVWDVNDRYSHCRAMPMRTSEGPVDWAMVYSDVDGEWIPRRPVSALYQPLSTEMLVDTVRSRLGCGVVREDVKYDRDATIVRVRMALDAPPIIVSDRSYDEGQPTAQGTPGVGDELLPMVQVVNSYDTTHQISVYAGWFRMICSNGLVIPAWKGAGFKSKRLHFGGSVEGLLNDIANWEPDFTDAPKYGQRFRDLAQRRLTPDEIAALVEQLPKRRQAGFQEHVQTNGGTAYAALMHLTHGQTHELSVTRAAILQPAVDTVIRLAA